MNQSEKLQQYVAKKQQAREHAQYLRQQRASTQRNNGGGGGGGGNSYASRGNSFNAKNRIIGDPLVRNNISENNMNPPWNNGSRNNFESNQNSNNNRDQFDNHSYDKRSRFGGNNDNFPANNNRAGYGNDTPFAKPRHNTANTGFDDNAAPDLPYNNNNNNGNNGYRGGFNNNNAGNNRPVNDWENTPLPKHRNNRNSQSTNNNNNNNHFDTQSQAYRGGGVGGGGPNVNNFGAANEARATHRTNRNVNSMQYSLDVVADNNDAMSTKTGGDGRGGSRAFSRSQSSDHVNSENNNIQYATADDVKKVLAMVDQLRGQMHALQFQINDVKEQNILLKQRVNELEEQLKQQEHQIKKQSNNTDTYFQAQEPAAMSRNANNHGMNDNRSNMNQFGGSSMHNNRNQGFNGNSMNSMQPQNNGNFGMEIDEATASGSSMRMSQNLRNLKDKQQTQPQTGRFGNNSNDNNQFNQPFNSRSNNNGFDSNMNRNSNNYNNFQPDNNQNNNNNNNGFSSNYSSRNMDKMNNNNNNMDMNRNRNRNMNMNSNNNNNNHPFPADDEEEAKAPPPSSAADLIAKLEQEQGAFIDPQQVQRIECHQCGRKFAEKALQRHMKICKKVFGQKRKQFNMAQQRADEEALKAAASTNRREIEAELERKRQKQKEKWKAQSTMLRQAVRQSKAIDQAIKDGKSLSDLPSMPAALDDRVPCPHCGRKFAEETAKRHIPKCQNIKSRPKALKRRK